MSKNITVATSAAISPWQSTIKPAIQSAEPMILGLVPRIPGVTPEQFVLRLRASFLNAAKATPALMACTPSSIVLSLAKCAALGLLPNGATRHAYLIPYKSECTFQIGYPGLVLLAHRTGYVQTARGVVVYKGDSFTWKEGLKQEIDHVVSLSGPRDDASIIAAYGVIEYKNGGAQARLLDRAAIDKRRGMSQSNKSESSPWNRWFAEMAAKTALTYALRHAAVSDGPDDQRLVGAMAHDDGEPLEVPGFDASMFESGEDTAGSLAEQAGG